MKKPFAILVVFLLFLSVLFGCAAKTPQEQAAASKTDQPATQKIDWPKKPITLIVPFAAGGGTDLGARILKPFLEQELGVPVVVENKAGAGGWIGWSELAKAKPDGYTIGYMNLPNVITGYVNPSANRKENLESFDFLINHVVDAGVLAVRSDDKRFSNTQEFLEYAKKNELSVNTSGVGSANHYVGLQMNKLLGTKFRFVHMSGTAEAMTSVLGGHVDVLIAGVGEANEQIKSGQLKALGVFGSDRVALLPDVPTFKESAGAEISKFSIRGLAGPKGMDPEVTAKLLAAIEKAEKNPEHVKKMNEMGMDVDPTKGEAYKQLLKKQEASILELKSVFGW